MQFLHGCRTLPWYLAARWRLALVAKTCCQERFCLPPFFSCAPDPIRIDQPQNRSTAMRSFRNQVTAETVDLRSRPL